MTEPENRVDTAQPAAPQTSRSVDIRVALIVLAAALFSALYLVPNFVRAPIEPRPIAMAPFMLPYVAIVMVSLAALGLLAAALRRPPAEPMTTGIAWVRLAAVLIAIAVFVFATPRLGALPAAVFASLILAVVGRSISLPLRILIAVAGPVSVYLVFTQLAGTPLPRGNWF